MCASQKTDEWRLFTRSWLEALIGFRNSTLTMEQGYDLIDGNRDAVDGEIVEFAGNVLSEISGFPRAYDETVELLKNDPTEHEVLAFMNS